MAAARYTATRAGSAAEVCVDAAQAGTSGERFDASDAPAAVAREEPSDAARRALDATQSVVACILKG